MLGALLGVPGQLLRVVVGIKKEVDEAQLANTATKDWFNGRELLVSVIFGALAGTVAAVVEYDPTATPTKDLLLGFMAAGYAGSDFIAGMMHKWLP